MGLPKKTANSHLNHLTNISLSTFKGKVNELMITLKKTCLENEPQKVASSLTIGFCMGLFPIIGLTIIVATAFGALFKLNQVILHTTHLLLTPIQILLIPFFFKFGMLLFHLPHINVEVIEQKFTLTNFTSILEQFGSILFCGLIVWFIVSLVLGLILYRILVIILSPKMKPKQA